MFATLLAAVCCICIRAFSAEERNRASQSVEGLFSTRQLSTVTSRSGVRIGFDIHVKSTVAGDHEIRNVATVSITSDGAAFRHEFSNTITLGHDALPRIVGTTLATNGNNGAAIYLVPAPHVGVNRGASFKVMMSVAYGPELIGGQIQTVKSDNLKDYDRPVWKNAVVSQELELCEISPGIFPDWFQGKD